MKKKILLSSIVTIALCLCMIVGSTFALFTSEKKLDVEVTAGEVTIDAELKNFKLWSVTPDANGTVADENGDTYSYVDPTTQGVPANTFLVGGTGTNDGELIKLDRIVPGDKVSFTIDTANTSDVTIWVRYTIKVADYTRLASGMVLNVNGTEYTGVASYTSVWTRLVKDANIDPVAIELGLPVFAGNEYQKGEVSYIVNVEAVQGNASVDNSYTTPIVEIPTAIIDDGDDLQNSVDTAVDGDIIYINDDITSDIVITQAPDRKIIIDGNGHNVYGTITIDGGSATIDSAGLTLRNFNFVNSNSRIDASIRLGDGTTNTRYVCNVTIENCTFDAADKVGIKSYTGGDYNVSIINCEATANAHSLAQLKGVNGVLVENCTVNSVRGINFNNSDNVIVKNSTINVQKYALRFGSDVDATVEIESFKVINCTLSSSVNAGDDSTIVLRAGSNDGNLELINTTVVGDVVRI